MQEINTAATYQIGSVAYPAGFIAYVNNWLNLTLNNPAKPTPGVSLPMNVTFSPSQMLPNFWNICMKSNGLDYCMDQYGNNVSQPLLHVASAYYGQQWNLTGKLQQDGTTVWQMQSAFGGPLNFLAACGLGIQDLALSMDAPVTDTLFAFIEVGGVSTATTAEPGMVTNNLSSTSDVLTALSSGTQASNNVSSPAPTSTSIVIESPSSLPKSAIIGIALGAAAFVIVVVAVSAFVIWSIRRGRSQQRYEPRSQSSTLASSKGQWTKAELPTVKMREVTPVHELSQTEWQNHRVHEMPARNVQ